MSSSTSSLAPPSPGNVKPRRMTSPSLPPPSPLDLPEPVYGHRRPPSPLRQSLTLDPRTGELSDDGSHESVESRPWGDRRSHSPTPSVAKFAANIAHRVGSLMSSRANHLPTDDELEAEAERERERSRREAERIMMQEAEDRRTVEERVLAMLHGDGGPPRALPPPPRPQTAPATPPSPTTSQKDSSWWSAAKNKLTPTKEPLTPAQQIIQDTKTREKELEKDKKKSDKMKQRSKEWPASPDGKLDDPSFLKLGLAAAPSPETPPRTTPTRPLSVASTSPVPIPRPQPSTPPSLASSPRRSTDARPPPPLYAQFDSQGTLDVPGTLLMVVKRFEKLEKWTVGHVRALEERMDDVERWLVEKEKAEKGKASVDVDENGDAVGVMSEVREELAELQGRVSELGREMAKMITAPGNLSSGPSRNSASITRAPSATSSMAVPTSSMAVRSISTQVSTSPSTTPPKLSGSISPPIGARNSRTRLPYPTGDYATPPETALLGQGSFSPPNSPPASMTSTPNTRRESISGLPAESSSASVSPAGLPRSASPLISASPSSLNPPNPSYRQNSMSPTPRKRYTVALGGPIMSANRADRDRDRDRERERPATPHSRKQSHEISTAFFSTSPVSAHDDAQDTTDDSDSEFGKDETIGKSAARGSGLSASSSSPTPARTRPQSMYAPKASQAIAAPAPVTPLNVRLRSRSTDRFGLGISDANGAPVTPTSAKFVDPLVVRRQTKEALASTIPDPPKVMPGKPKVPVGRLVAYFDQEKQ